MFVRLRVHAALVCAPTSRGRISDGNEKVAAGTKRAFLFLFLCARLCAQCIVRVFTSEKKERVIVLFLFVVFFNVINEMSLLCCAAVELARDFFSFHFFSR